MLNTLRRIVQEVNNARNLDQALLIIVQRVKQAMVADVCTIYLRDDVQQQYTLMATEGLNTNAVGNVRLGFNEGLVGLAAERAEPVNLANAPEHPNFKFFPQTGEDAFHAFLGVPIIHHRIVLGVLVVQRSVQQSFDEDHVTLLITIAAQLAGAIAHAEANGEIERLLEAHDHEVNLRPLHGLRGAPGVAIGTAVVAYPQADLDAVPERTITDIEAEIQEFLQAVAAVKQDIQRLSSRLAGILPDEDRALFDAYLLMLDSHSLGGMTIKRIEEGHWAPGALRHTVMEQVQRFADMEDPYLRERAEDLRDLGRRVLERLQQDSPHEREYPAKTVLLGDELSAAMLAEVPREKLVGVVSARGSHTSHVAILCRALGVPAVMGVVDLPVSRVDGNNIIADGYSGTVYISPAKAIREEYTRLATEEASQSNALMELRDQPAMTSDGEKIPLYVNTGLLSDTTPARESGTDGIGLYRTEFPFMIRQRFPGEEEQRTIYRQVLEGFAPQPVTLRTLDVGGDKSLPYFPIVEDNPFLGWRGIRITLDHPEIFLVQVRAMLRASSGLNNLQILLPMISGVAELYESLALIHRAYFELIEDDERLTMPKLGAMIEVPSAVYQAGELAELVDFLSIGTNDLTQYLLAVDRNNVRVADLYDGLHPAVLKAVLQVIEQAHARSKPVSICGEMAGDPAAVLLLVGMGIDSLSMSASSLPQIKWVVRNITRQSARELLDEALQMQDARSIRQYLNSRLEAAGMGGLVRAGS